MRYLIFCFIFLASFTHAQIDASWSDELNYNCSVIKTIPKDRNSYYVVTVTNSSAKEFRIHLFTFGKMQFENTFSPKLNNAINTIIDIHLLNDQLYLFYSDEHSSGNKLYVQRIDERCQLVGTPVLLKEQEIKGGLNSKAIDYYVNVSPNGKYLSVSYLYNNTNVFEFPELVTTIYNENLFVKKEEKIKTEYYLSETSLESISVNNEGTVLLLLQGYKRPSSSKLKYNSLDLYKIHGKNTTEHVILDTDGYSFFNPIVVKNNDSLYTIAFQYNTMNRNKPNPGSKGVMFYEYSTMTDSLSERMEIEFDKKELLNSLSAKERSRYDKAVAKGKEYNLALQRYKLREFTVLADGSRLLSMEESWIEVRSYQTGRFYTTYTIYNYNNILLMKIDPQLVRDYSVVIPKIQISRDDNGYYSSYFQYLTPTNHLYLMFNDNLQNYSASGDYTGAYNPYNFTFNANKYCTALIDFDITTGQYTRRPLFDKNDADNLFVPRLFEQDELYKTILLTFNKRSRYRFAQVFF